MTWIDFRAFPYPTSSGTYFIVVAIDEEGELWFYDTGEKLPGPAWHPLPVHPRYGMTAVRAARARKRRR